MTLTKALITNTVTHDQITVLFNPEEYTVNKDNNYAQAAVPGLKGPLLQFVHGNMGTLEMELFLDTYEAQQDVRDLTKQITKLLEIVPALHAPPPLIFTWGSLDFTCVLARASQRFIMFLSDGTPVRARLQVTFNEFINTELEAKETKRETADFSSFYVVGQNETLSGIAARVYENPALWRPIALRNRLDNPRVLPVGLELLIPRLPYRHPETGEVLS